MKMIWASTMAFVFCFCLGLLTGCNTVKGIGKDVSTGGHDIERAAS